jgi:hypothetical protein
VQRCYGAGAVPAATALAATPPGGCLRNCTSVTLALPAGGASFDRVLIKEELSNGQLVTGFELLADGVVVFNGSSVGRSLVARLSKPVAAARVVELRVTATRWSPNSGPGFRLVAVPDPASCQVGRGRFVRQVGGGGNGGD